MATFIETVIVGAGVSGLACANKLHAAGKDFVVISKDIGGRVKPSAINPTINLGGVYINSDYFNLMPFVDIVEPFRVRDFYFFDGENYVTILSLRNIKYLPKIVRLIGLLWQFRNRLNAMRRSAEQEELCILIESDPLLKKYWHMSATDFLQRHGFEELDRQFGQPTAATNVFTTSKDMNAFYYLYLFLTMIRPAYIVDLSKTTDRLSRGFENKFIISEVSSIKKQKTDEYLVVAGDNEFVAKNVVIAAPYLDIVGAYDIPKPSIITSIFTYYVKGSRKAVFADKKGVVLHPDVHDAYLLWEQQCGGDLIYARTADLDLSKYYSEFTILDKVFWKTGMQITNNAVIGQKLDVGLYLASDYNFSLMEDAFITGLYAANQIIGK